MKYLIHFRPPEEVFEKVNTYRSNFKNYLTRVPGAGLHCTLLVGNLCEDRENEIVKSLSDISIKSFEASLNGDLEFFDEGALVSRVKCENNGLNQLHYSVLRNLKRFINKDENKPLPGKYPIGKARRRVYENYGSMYFGSFYQPHITFANIELSKRKKISLENPLDGITWNVDEIILSRKDEHWVTIDKFLIQKD
jgi:hypothetical protein